MHFSEHLRSDEPAAPGRTATAGHIARIDALLALQELPDALSGRRRAVKRGQNLLDRLDDIRHGLLLGQIPLGRLQALAQALRTEREVCEEKRLAELIEEIELRCLVELEKFGQNAKA
jgi:hypothetical protein